MPDPDDRLRPPPALRLASPVQHVDLTGAVRQLRSEPHLATDGYRSVTLVHRETARLVLLAFDAGGRIPPHDARGPVTLQVLHGRVRVGTPDGDVLLAPGELLALDTAVTHDVEALESSDVLLGVHPLDAHAPPSPVSDGD